MMGWLHNLFRRPAPQTPPPGDSPEDWQPGDLAECIHRGPWFWGGSLPNQHAPALGDVRMVKRVTIGIDGIQLLVFSAWEPVHFSSCGFRKVRLDPDRQFRREAEFVPIEIIAPKRETTDV